MTDTDAVSEAEKAAEDADREVARVEQALLDGDESVGPSDLVDAEEERGKLRRAFDAAKRIATERAERKAEAVRLTRIDELDALITARFGAHEGGIVDGYEAVLDSITVLCERVADHNAGLTDICNELRDVAPLPKRLKLLDDGLRLRDPDVQISTVNAEQLIAEAAKRAARHDYPHPVSMSKIGGVAHLGPDRASAQKLGIPQNPDGTWPLMGASDELRRTARIVAERDTTTDHEDA